jgi:ABC-2 type transport system ATP-binding protein
MTIEPAIQVEGLVKAYGKGPVLTGVDFTVPRGSIYALLGPNGAGKTTLVRILSTLTVADGGVARVAGHDVRRAAAEVRRRISLTGQYAAVDDLQTGVENLTMMGRLVGLSRKQSSARAAELLDRFDLRSASKRLASTYSGGMRRRLDLAASLVGAPEVIFLDEPTTGLDLPSRQAMWQVITELATGSGVTVLLTTQYLDEADRLASRVGVLDKGRIIADGSSAELKAQVAEQRLELVAADADAYQRIAAALAGRILASDGAARTLTVATDGSAAHVRELLDHVDPDRRSIDRFSVHTATLDDVFLVLTEHASEHEANLDENKELANV